MIKETTIMKKFLLLPLKILTLLIHDYETPISSVSLLISHRQLKEKLLPTILILSTAVA